MPRSGSDVVFDIGRAGHPISNMAMTMTLRRMDRGEITVHGFRSTFRDWAAERTNHPNHVVEMALAHTIGDKVEAAYRRGDLLEEAPQADDGLGALLHRMKMKRAPVRQAPGAPPFRGARLSVVGRPRLPRAAPGTPARISSSDVVGCQFGCHQTLG